MDYSSDDKKINMYLNELADEYKQLLLKKLIEESNSVEHLRVTELFRIDNEIKQPLLKDSLNKNKKKKKVYVYAAMLYFFMGQLLILMDCMNSMRSIDVIPMIGQMISSIGILLILIVIAFPDEKLSKNKKNNKGLERTNNRELIEYEVVKTWKYLEAVASDLDIENKSNVRNAASAIETLKVNGLISINDVKTLRMFLKMRNEVVHNTSIKYSTSQMKEMLKKVNLIVEKLNKII